MNILSMLVQNCFAITDSYEFPPCVTCNRLNIVKGKGGVSLVSIMTMKSSEITP